MAALAKTQSLSEHWVQYIQTDIPASWSDRPGKAGNLIVIKKKHFGTQGQPAVWLQASTLSVTACCTSGTTDAYDPIALSKTCHRGCLVKRLWTFRLQAVYTGVPSYIIVMLIDSIGWFAPNMPN